MSCNSSVRSFETSVASEDQPRPASVIKAWEDFVEEQVYPVPNAKAKSDYRNYEKPARDTVCEFYRQYHRHQTYDFVRQNAMRSCGATADR